MDFIGKFNFNLNTLMDFAIKTFSESYIAAFIAVPMSMLLFLLFSKFHHKIIVNLGDQKWLIK